MYLFSKNIKHHFIILLLLITCAYAIAQNPPPKKIYSPKERQIEEARIRKDIEEKSHWQSYYPKSQDDESDTDRWLFSKNNQSILLRQSTGERFGIYESFNDKDNTRNFEIRLHKNNKLTARFLHYYEDCYSESLVAEKVTNDYVLYRETCSIKDRSALKAVYLYHYASKELYILDGGKSGDYKKPTIAVKNGVYKFRWESDENGYNKNFVAIKNFKIFKDKNGKWKVEELPPINDEWSSIEPIEKLPIKQEYDLPDFVYKWEKK